MRVIYENQYKLISSFIANKWTKANDQFLSLPRNVVFKTSFKNFEIN